MQSLEHVVFDTAPTGHTLRLLELPVAWSRFLDTSATALSCLGPLVGLKAQQARYAEAVRTLADARATRLVLVTRRRSAVVSIALCLVPHAGKPSSQCLWPAGGRKEVERFLTSHGEATDAEDRLILDYIASNGAPLDRPSRPD